MKDDFDQKNIHPPENFEIQTILGEKRAKLLSQSYAIIWKSASDSGDQEYLLAHRARHTKEI